MQVKATAKGFYGSEIKNIGDTFPLKSEKDFSDRWMEKVGKTAAAPAPAAENTEDGDGTPETLGAVANQELNASANAVKIAKEAGLDLTLVKGTGANGQITKGDVDRYMTENQ